MADESVLLRGWQAEALERFAASDRPDFLVEACPGAGKTTVASAAAVESFRQGECDQLLVVVPTRHLKRQWALAAHALGLELDPAFETPAGPSLSVREFDGAVVTYQQVASAPGAFHSWVAQHRTLAILDEIHHAQDQLGWGEALDLALTPAERRLSLSGTPFRSDARPIPFLRYERGRVCPDVRYDYRAALGDRVCRPIFFPRAGGQVAWRYSDGEERDVSFADFIPREEMSDRLRAAFDPAGGWMAQVLAAAHRRLVSIREIDPDAGGLVLALDQTHARELVHRLAVVTGRPPALAVSDDPGASETISRFRGSREPWLVAVRMVSEGVDVPRLRVGVWATVATTDLFFRQVVGRFVRCERGHGAKQFAALYLPDDPRLRQLAAALAEDTDHYLEQQEKRAAEAPQERQPEPSRRRIVPLRSSAAFTGTIAPVETTTPSGQPVSRSPVPWGIRREELRRRTAKMAFALATRSGRPSAVVQAELNRATGFGSTRTMPRQALQAKERLLARQFAAAQRAQQVEGAKKAAASEADPREEPSTP